MSWLSKRLKVNKNYSKHFEYYDHIWAEEIQLIKNKFQFTYLACHEILTSYYQVHFSADWNLQPQLLSKKKAKW